jgi:Ni/Fe-hydrogenase subunit HybB-like protein
MGRVLQSAIVIVGAVFGGSVGVVLALAGCLVLRDAFAWSMPLSRIALIASIFAAAGAGVSVLIDLVRWRAAVLRASSSSDPSHAESNGG